MVLKQQLVDLRLDLYIHSLSQNKFQIYHLKLNHETITIFEENMGEIF